jgi:DNA-binding MarR family transcriptional regulator
MRRDTAWVATDGGPDLGPAGAGLAVLLEAYEQAVEQLGATVPSAQVRALLIIDGAGSMNLSGLASALRARASAVSRLCDRMEAAGLLSRDRAAASRREIVLVATQAGRQLAQSVRDSRRTALRNVLQSMSPDGQDALVRGLSELAAARPR